MIANAEACSLLLYDTESEELYFSVPLGDSSQRNRQLKEADETSGFKTRSLLAVPMVQKEHLIGVLEVVNKIGEKVFSTFDERIMELFASLGASVILQARLIDENLQAERMVAIGQTVAALSHYSKNLLGSVRASIEIIDECLDD